MHAVIETREGASLHQQLREFVAAGSTEVTTHDERTLEELARTLPAGYRVYVAHTPKAALDEVARVALRLQELGLEASPHIVARRVKHAGHLRRVLDALGAGGVGQVLLVAGDVAEPGAAFTSTVELLETGMLGDSGITRVGVAGHPEGHPVVPAPVLWEALARKQAIARATGLRMHIATQFGFDTRSLTAFEAGLAARGIQLPVHAGVAGPTPLLRLLKYAAQCGVGASLGAVAGKSAKAARLPNLVTRAEEMLLGVLSAKHGNRDSRIFAPHFFAFGGVLETARWVRAVIEGSFALNKAGRGFSIL